MGSNEEIRRLAQEAEKQQLFAQKVQQQNMTLTSQLEMYKERVRILEGINKDNNYLNEFLEADERAKRYNKQAQSQLVRAQDIIRDLEKQRDKLELDYPLLPYGDALYAFNLECMNWGEANSVYTSYIVSSASNGKIQAGALIFVLVGYIADEWAKRYNKQAQSQFVRDRDIIRDLEKQRDKLELDVKDYKRQKEEYQKRQTIFNQTQCNKEEKYLDDILQLQAKIKDLEMLFKSGLGYNDPYVLSQAYAKIPKLYNAYELCNKSEQLHVFDSEETLEDTEKSQLIMNEFQKDEKVQELKIQLINYGKLNKLYENFVPQKDLSAEQTYFPSSCISSISKISSEEFSSKTKPSMASMPSANPMLVDLNEMENIFQTLFKLIQKSCKRDEKEMNPIV
ncbi:hypothetical protein Tco_1336549 [Tanacetum coccineum]